MRDAEILISGQTQTNKIMSAYFLQSYCVRLDENLRHILQRIYSGYGDICRTGQRPLEYSAKMLNVEGRYYNVPFAGNLRMCFLNPVSLTNIWRIQ
ncbi:MAG: hypothetical protein DSY58_04885 [Desulfobulbus sp.]|nr:MAG: hypothetical protein DSY58_04885 [Desulfobulbus sp.]